MFLWRVARLNADRMFSFESGSSASGIFNADPSLRPSFASDRPSQCSPCLSKRKSSTAGIWLPFAANAADLFHALRQSALPSPAGRVVIAASGERRRKALHTGDFTLDIVCVLVALAVVQRLHKPGGRIAQV